MIPFKQHSRTKSLNSYILVYEGRYNILAPFRRPFADLSNAAFVINLKPDVSAPDAAKPAKKDCNIHAVTVIKF